MAKLSRPTPPSPPPGSRCPPPAPPPAARAPPPEPGRAPGARPLFDGETLALDGPEPQAWQVLHTPGHAPGHVCLYEPALGALVAGDMAAGAGTILTTPGDGAL